MKIGSLFTGYGGLDQAARAVFGGELAWVSDNHPSAVKLLGHRHPDVPNLGDITAIDWAAVEPVDVLTAGFPCQDISNAGKRAGIEGERSGLWSYVADAVRVLRPRHVVLENVSAILVRGLDRVVADLAEAGYDLRWTCLRASDVGAPHRRERWFGYATPADADCSGWQGREPARRYELSARRLVANSEGERHGDTGTQGVGGIQAAAVTSGERETAANANRDGVREQPVSQFRCHGEAVTVQPRSNGTPADPADNGPQELHDRPGGDGTCGSGLREPAGGAGLSPVGWGPFDLAIRRWERILGRPATVPSELNRNGNPVLSPRFVEWLMGLEAGWVSEVPGLSRAQMLRLLGNGVVPRQGQAALQWLASIPAREAA